MNIPRISWALAGAALSLAFGVVLISDRNETKAKIKEINKPLLAAKYHIIVAQGTDFELNEDIADFSQDSTGVFKIISTQGREVFMYQGGSVIFVGAPTGVNTGTLRNFSGFYD